MRPSGRAWIVGIALLWPVLGICDSVEVVTRDIALVAVIDAPDMDVGFWNRVAGRNRTLSFVRPYGVAWFRGDLLVTDPNGGRVLRFNSAGREAMAARSKSEEPIGVAVCKGRIFVTDSRAGSVEELDDHLEHRSWAAEGLRRPTGLACLDNGLAVVETGAHRVVVLSDDGSRMEFGSRGAGSGEFNYPIAAVSNGTSVYVLDALNFRVQQFDGADFGFVKMFGQLGDSPGDMPRPKGIAVDSSGNVWVSDGHLDQVSGYDADGRYLMSLGETGTEPGSFEFPAGLAFDPLTRRLAVVDSFNRRVQIFQLSGAVAK